METPGGTRNPGGDGANEPAMVIELFSSEVLVTSETKEQSTLLQQLPSWTLPVMDGQGVYLIKDIWYVGERVVFKREDKEKEKAKNNTTLDKALKLLKLPFNNLQKETKYKKHKIK